MYLNSATRIIGLFGSLLILGGCLRTRSQVNENSLPTETGESVAAPPVVNNPENSYLVDELKAEVARLIGRVDQLERQKNDESKDPSNQEFVKKLENRIAELENSQSAMIEHIKTLENRPTPVDEKALFDQAKESFQESEWDKVIELTSEILKNEKSKFGEEATFLRAEAFYKKKQYKKAIVDYSRFPESFNKSKYMPRALLNIGRSFEHIGSPQDAQAFYELLKRDFPKSSEAKKISAKGKN